MRNIEFLSDVNIREVWKREDRDFTPWLAQEEPLRHLLLECGIDIEDNPKITPEYKVPGVRRWLDLLVETENDGLIAIENQYSEADHDHLTRAMAYGVAIDARAVIVIAENHRPEFIELARYLNNAAISYKDKGIPLFLVKVSVHSAPQSDSYYPSFELVTGPEEWKSVVSKSLSSEGGSRDALIYDYFDRLLPLLRQSTGVFNEVSPSSNHWQAGAGGMAGVQISVNVAKSHSSVQIWIHRGDERENHMALDVLLRYQDQVKDQFTNQKLDWRKSKTAIFEVKHEGIGYQDPSDADLEKVSHTAGLLYSFLQDHLDEIRLEIERLIES